MIVQDSYRSQTEESQAMDLIVDNLLRLKNQMAEVDQHHSPTSSSSQQELDNTNIDNITNHYNQFLRKLPADFKNTPYEKKISFLLQQKNVGALIYLFELIYHFRDALPEKALINISQKLTKNITFQSQLQIRCMFELLAYIGVIDEIMIQNIYQLILEESLPFDIGFLFLSNMGIVGLQILVEIAGGQFNGLPLQTLNNLARNQMIIQEIIIPCLLSDVHNTTDSKKKTTALAIMNRLYHLTADTQLVQTLSKLYQQQKDASDKNRCLISSILRSSGSEGEKQLIKLLKSSNNNKHKLPIINVMAWKVPDHLELDIQVIEYTISSNFTPGCMYRYEGSLQPSANQRNHSHDTLYLNSRDFLAALNRFIAAIGGQTMRDQVLRASQFSCSDLSLLVNFVKNKEKIQKHQAYSEEMIKSLNLCLNSPIVEMRSASLRALGTIGLPTAPDSIQKVYKCLSDPESNNRSMACWTLSKICNNPTSKIVKKLVQLLRDSFWKVRNEACVTISKIVEVPDQLVVTGLIRALKDGSINRQTVCQTLIRLGQIGQQVLIDLLKLTNPTDFKIKSAIISSFKLANVASPTIDYLIEELFKHCSDENSLIRRSCLQCLNALRIRSAEENITYLKAKNILPLFYYFLEDSCPKLRELAVQSILSFGSHAELIFIEGLTKSTNHVVRCQCVKGLSQMGPQNFRAILFGLRDQDQRVRVSTAGSILNYLPVQKVIGQFQFKENHIPSLCCHLKQILEGYTLIPQIEEYFEYLLQVLSAKKHSSKRTAFNDQNFDSNQ